MQRMKYKIMLVLESMKRVAEITGKTVPTYSVDLLDKDGLRDMFQKVHI